MDLEHEFRLIGTNTFIAEKCGIRSRSCVTHWATGDRDIPPQHCVMLEYLSQQAGASLTREKLRPDVFYEVTSEGEKVWI